MSQEGEFYKRINALVNSSHSGLDPDSAEDIKALIDEAEKEYFEIDFRLCLDAESRAKLRAQWFNKWFGFKEVKE